MSHAGGTPAGRLRLPLFAAIVLGLVLVVAGCGTDAVDEPPAPEEIVMAFLAAAAGGAPDRGWSELHPVTRAEMFANDRDAYIAMANAGPWNGFEWAVMEVVPDDPSFHFVYLAIRADDVPALLIESRNNFSLLGQLDPRSPAELAVRYDRDGYGIWPKGG